MQRKMVQLEAGVPVRSSGGEVGEGEHSKVQTEKDLECQPKAWRMMAAMACFKGEQEMLSKLRRLS